MSSPAKKDAFAVLMTNAGRNQKSQGQHNKRPAKTPPSSSLKPKRHDSSDEPQSQSNASMSQQQSLQHQEQQSQPAQPSRESVQQEQQSQPAQPSRQQTAAASKQVAVDAFKRVFSAGLSKASQPAAQKFDYLLVYDLEATTNKARSLNPVEIIELSCVIVQTATASITASFQTYVRPTEHPQLDPFCVELCGIQQSQVDAAPLLADAMQLHHEWLQQQGVLAEGVSSVPVTWTEWDLKVALCTECRWRNIQRPDYLCRWVDLKRYYKAKYRRAGNLRTCVEAAGLTWQGRAHSGIDDATNTANLALHLMCQQGVQFEVTQVSENPPVLQPQQHQAPKLLGSQNRSHSGGGGVGSPAAAAAAATTSVVLPSGSPQQDLASSQAAAGVSSPPSATQSSTKGRLNMVQLAAQKGAVGVFDGSGRWLGRCFCGAKAKNRVTKRPGPNHGRKFWSCGRWTITAQQSSSCDFFMWADEVQKGSVKGGGG